MLEDKNLLFQNKIISTMKNAYSKLDLIIQLIFLLITIIDLTKNIFHQKDFISSAILYFYLGTSNLISLLIRIFVIWNRNLYKYILGVIIFLGLFFFEVLRYIPYFKIAFFVIPIILSFYYCYLTFQQIIKNNKI